MHINHLQGINENISTQMYKGEKGEINEKISTQMYKDENGKANWTRRHDISQSIINTI